MKLTEEERRQVFMQTILIIFSFTFFLALLGCATTTPTDAGKQTALSGNQETVHEAGDPETQLNHAISLIEKGKLDEAIDQLLKTIEKNPNYDLAYSNLGAVYYHKGKLDKATEALKKAIELNPGDRNAHSSLGNLYSDSKKYDEAIAEHRKVIELAPNDAKGFVDLGVAFSQKGDIAEGINQYKRALSINPYHPLARKNLGHSYYRMKKWSEAIDELLLARDIDAWWPGLEESIRFTLREAYPDLEKWVKEKPMDSLSHYYLAYAYEFKGEWKKAMEEIIKAIELNRSKGEFYKGKALFYSSDKKPNEAITALRECITIDPSNWACYNDLGGEYDRIEKPKGALEMIIQASSIAPDVISVQLNLGSAYFNNGEYQKSIAPLKRALTLSERNNPRIDLILAVAYFKLQEYDMAWKHVRRAEKMGHPDASRLMKDLKRVSKEPQ